MRINEENYVDKAEKVIQELRNEVSASSAGRFRKKLVTTSKIRGFLSIASDIYNDAIICQSETLPSDLLSRIQYLRVRIAYEVGRDTDNSVRDFVTRAELLDILKEIGSSRKNYILFYRYMEALVAFHRYYGGKD